MSRPATTVDRAAWFLARRPVTRAALYLAMYVAIALIVGTVLAAR